jgi:hypothetical protein
MSWNLLASTTKQSPAGGGAFTTDPIDTTGVDLLVVCVVNLNGGGTYSDSNSNSWTSIGPVGSASAMNLTIFAKWHPTVGSGHTFSVSASPGIPKGSMVVLGYSGSLVASTAIDQSSGDVIESSTTVQAGSITPLADGELIVSAVAMDGVAGGNQLSINLGYTELFELPWSGDHNALAVASLIQTVAAATNPTWTCTDVTEMISIITSFKVEPPTDGIPFFTTLGAKRI